MPFARSRRRLDVALIALFAVALAAPAADHLARPSAREDVLRERRLPAPIPARPVDLASARAFPSGFESWWGDAFGLRDVLLKLRSRVAIEGFGVSPSSDVVLGRDRWVFPTMLGMLDISTGATRLSESRLESWRTTLESRRDFCESLGASYVIAFAPEKSTIYPDQLPAGWSVEAPTAYDQLVAWLRERSDVHVLDLREVLRDERARDRGDDFAYYPLGTHWTDRGMLAAWTAIVEVLAPRHPNLRAPRAGELAWQDDPEEGDTWAHLLRMQGRMHQRSRVLRAVELGYECEIGRDEPEPTHVTVRGGDPQGPRIALFHDSFGDRMRKVAALTCSHGYFAWQGALDPERVIRERPDVVVELYAERKIVVDRPVPIAFAGRDPLRERFDAATSVLFTLPRGAPQLFTPVNDAHVALDGEALAIEQSSGADWVELAPFAFAPGRACIVAVELESERPGSLDVMYTTRRAPRYGRAQVASATYAAGRTRAHVVLDAPDLQGGLRLRFSRDGGTTRLWALEARAPQ